MGVQERLGDCIFARRLTKDIIGDRTKPIVECIPSPSLIQCGGLNFKYSDDRHGNFLFVRNGRFMQILLQVIDKDIIDYRGGLERTRNDINSFQKFITKEFLDENNRKKNQSLYLHKKINH